VDDTLAVGVLEISVHKKAAKRRYLLVPSAPLIAIVDDDDALRNSLDDLIRSIGFRTLGFSSAEEFLTSNQARDAACLILDVRMPAMSGLDLQQQIVAAKWQTPIIFVTSHADDDARLRALAAGAVAYLYKPFHEKELLNAIDAALKRSSGDEFDRSLRSGSQGDKP
jgi:FixJ family two-component response regulator